MITIKAPAKINLTLEVLRKRADGYHEVRSVMQTIDLCDTLHFKNSEKTKITGKKDGWNPDLSLVTKTVALLRAETGCPEGIQIIVEKKIPLMAGLGGDSSDAAATLMGLNQAWNLKLTPDRLIEIAAKLGSDVPFFIRGGTTQAAGRGEILTALKPPAMPVWFVVIMPDTKNVPGKTGRMYSALKSSQYTDGRKTDSLVKLLEEGKPFGDDSLYNVFEKPAEEVYPRLEQYKDILLKLGSGKVNLAGSGPALYVMVDELGRGEELVKGCRETGMEAWVGGVYPNK